MDKSGALPQKIRHEPASWGNWRGCPSLTLTETSLTAPGRSRVPVSTCRLTYCKQFEILAAVATG